MEIMENKKRIYNISNNIKDIYTNFFNNKTTRKASYQAFKTAHYEKVYDLINNSNCENPEKAFRTMNKLLGMKEMFELIKEQKELAEKI